MKKRTKRIMALIALGFVISLSGVIGKTEAAPSDNIWGPLTKPTDYDYSIMALPDTQNLCDYRPDNLTALFLAIRQQITPEKIKFLLHVGDLTNRDANKERQFQDARTAFAYLDGKVPYAFVPGNHDYRVDYNTTRPKDLSTFNAYFKYDDYKDTPTFGGAYAEGYMDNTYHMFEEQGVKYLVMAFEQNPSSAVLDWADGIVSSNPDRRTIYLTHDYLERNKTRSAVAGEAIWSSARKHANVFMILCGHRDKCDPGPNVVLGDNGNRIAEIMLCYQNTFDEGGHNIPLAMMMKFNETKKEFYAYVYNPVREQEMRDSQLTHIDDGKTGNFAELQNINYTYSFADEKNPTIGLPGQPDQDDGTPTPPGTAEGCAKSAATLLPVLALTLLVAKSKKF